MTTTARTTPKKLVNVPEVLRTLSLLTEPGQVVEIRALDASTQPNSRYTETLSGYFDDPKFLTQYLPSIQQAMGIYLTLQPCDPELINRAENKIKRAGKNATTADKNITRYSWLPIDCDPERLALISSTDEEHEKALARAQYIKEQLAERGWPAPIEADSGNGGHLLYRIDLPVTDADLLKRVLEGLANEFSIPGIKIDQTVYNPARIWKLYGTLACKGDDTTRRPHRMSRLIAVPEQIVTVSREQLEQMAAPEPVSEPAKTSHAANLYGEAFTGETFIRKHGIDTYEPESYNGGTRWLLKACPFCGEQDRSAVIIQNDGGRLGFKCQHDRCSQKDWRALRLHFEPGAYDRKLGLVQKSKVKPEQEDDEDEQKGRPESVAMQLVKMAEPYLEIFSNTAGVRYARISHNGHYETMIISEKGSFRRWLHYLYEQETGLIPNSKALSDVIHTFESRAQFGSSKIEEVYLRVAYIEEKNTVYLDMANKDYQVIEISARGWKILEKSPVCFRRTASMAPLPIPIRGGSTEDLREFINADDDGWILIKSWELGCLQPSGLEFGEYPILALSGGQGAAKTSAARRLRSVFDPSVAPLRKQPKDDQAFAIMAHNNFVVGLDNLSHLSNDLSDSMCTLSTGAGDAYRKLYADDEEAIFVAKRPQVFTGIEQLATRGDLLDRCLLVTLKDISDEQRKDSTELNKFFNEKHPFILGAFLDCAVEALKNRPSVKMDKKPRLADFAMFVTAAEKQLGLEPGQFMEVYNRNRTEGVASEIEASPVALAIMRFMEGNVSCSYSATVLYGHLVKALDNEQITKSKAWPQSPRGLSAQIKRLTRSLRAINLSVEFGRTNGERSITITQIPHSLLSDAKLENSDAKLENSDAKLENSDAKLENSDANDDAVTQKNSGLRHCPNGSAGNFTYSVTQSAAKTPTSLSLTNIKKEESSSSSRVDSEREKNLRHFASPTLHPQTCLSHSTREVFKTTATGRYCKQCWDERQALEDRCKEIAEFVNYRREAFGRNEVEGKDKWEALITSASDTKLELIIGLGKREMGR